MLQATEPPEQEDLPIGGKAHSQKSFTVEISFGSFHTEKKSDRGLVKCNETHHLLLSLLIRNHTPMKEI